MVIGDRLRQLREAKKLSQGDVEKKTNLLRCYTSRVENGHTVPTVETLEKYAGALDVPLYRFFYDGQREPERLKLDEQPQPRKATSKETKELRVFVRLLSRMKEGDRTLLLAMAQGMARRNKRA